MRGERLRCKTVQVSIERHRELAALGKVRASEERVRRQVRERETRFWRELTATYSHQSQLGASHGGGSLARALEAHRQMGEARAKLSTISKEVARGIGRVARADAAVMQFRGLRGEEIARLASQSAERLGEEIGELAALRKESIARDDGGALCGRTLSGDEEAPGASSTRVSTGSSPHLPSSWSEERILRSSERAEPVRSAAAYDATCFAELSFEGRAPQLTLTVVHQDGVRVRCQVREKGGGEVGVVVGSEHEGVVRDLCRDRGALLSKLSTLGIRVKRLDVERVLSSDPNSNLLNGYKRRRPGDFDETAVA